MKTKDSMLGRSVTRTLKGAIFESGPRKASLRRCHWAMTYREGLSAGITALAPSLVQPPVAGPDTQTHLLRPQ